MSPVCRALSLLGFPFWLMPHVSPGGVGVYSDRYITDWSIFGILILLRKCSDVNYFLVIGHGTPMGVSFQGNSI